jgi:hypothetical protein
MFGLFISIILVIEGDIGIFGFVKNEECLIDFYISIFLGFMNLYFELYYWIIYQFKDDLL